MLLMELDRRQTLSDLASEAGVSLHVAGKKTKDDLKHEVALRVEGCSYSLSSLSAFVTVDINASAGGNCMGSDATQILTAVQVRAAIGRHQTDS